MNYENIERAMKGTDFGTAGIPPLVLTKGYVELMLGASHKTLLIVDHPPLRNLYYSNFIKYSNQDIECRPIHFL